MCRCHPLPVWKILPAVIAAVASGVKCLHVSCMQKVLWLEPKFNNIETTNNKGYTILQMKYIHNDHPEMVTSLMCPFERNHIRAIDGNKFDQSSQHVHFAIY